LEKDKRLGLKMGLISSPLNAGAFCSGLPDGF